METDKINLSDQIVLLRKCVKIAKVHIIRRLFRQMKMYRQKKGRKEEDTRKHQQKAERLKKEMAIITKLHPDIVSKTALKEEKDWNKFILQKDITTEERSLARLICHKKIQEKILQFRNEHPDWQSWLPSTLQKWERKKLAKLERNDLAAKDSSANSEEEQNAINEFKISNTKKQDINETEVKSHSKSTVKKHINKKDSLLPDNEVKENKNIGENKIKSKKGKINKHKSKKNEKQTTEENECENALSTYLKPKCDIVDRVEGSMEIAEINLDKLDDEEIIPVHYIACLDGNVSAESNTKPKKKARDDFFLGRNDDESNQGSCSESDNSVSDNEGQSPAKPKTQFVSSLSGANKNDSSQLRKRINPKFFPKQDDGMRNVYRRGQQKNWKRQPEEVQNRNKRKFSSFTEDNCNSSMNKWSRKIKDNSTDSKLHPSWEAKKKLKQVSILPFKGKKIQFDING